MQEALEREIRNCNLCSDLPLGPNPIFKISPKAKILLISQAPGTKAHESNIAWHDKSGNRLRSWLGMSEEEFYNPENIGIMPMSLCYPGKGKSGDLPPRKECAPAWHGKILDLMPEVKLKVLIGNYAIKHYLPNRRGTLTETVLNWQNYLNSGYFPLVHPSPLNTFWLLKNKWFESELVPELRQLIRSTIS